ncbi:uncharacterized protein LOC113312221 [Papaver somniferum]|uniref:uncharacterized protein LOC113312221 n=1 Tax=Papaver somniferum TaxID=3469 RepID=UPI000E6F8E79|nr:uncharacterized protein LOC113312221 [Papaver somniferum]
MERWTKNANKSLVLNSDRLEIKDGKAGMEAMRIIHYCRRSVELAYMYLGKSEKAYDVAIDFLNQDFEKIKEIDIVELGKEHGQDMQKELFADVEPKSTTDQSYAASTTTEVPNDALCVSSSTNTIIGDPRISQTKGRKTEKGKENAAEDLRIKSGIELSKEARKPRICRYCGLGGHDSRTCKKRRLTS